MEEDKNFGYVLRHLGAMEIPLLLMAGLVILLIVLLFVDYFSKNWPSERYAMLMKSLLVSGSMTLALGMLGQIMGIWFALAAILQAADISPAIVTEGLMRSFSATFFGFLVFFVSMIFWLAFNYLTSKNKTKVH